MSTSLRARKMKVEAVDAKAELILRSLDSLHRRLTALQAITVELASRCDLAEGDVLTLASELSAKYPPEIAPALRDEIARLIQP